MTETFKLIIIHNDEKEQKISIYVDGQKTSVWKYNELCVWSEIFFDYILSIIKEKIYLTIDKYKGELK
jgi:hypothetical protein